MARHGSAVFITVATVAFLCPTEVAAQTREVAFSTDEGTWLSLDVSPRSRALSQAQIARVDGLRSAGRPDRPAYSE